MVTGKPDAELLLEMGVEGVEGRHGRLWFFVFGELAGCKEETGRGVGMWEFWGRGLGMWEFRGFVSSMMTELGFLYHESHSLVWCWIKVAVFLPVLDGEKMMMGSHNGYKNVLNG